MAPVLFMRGEFYTMESLKLLVIDTLNVFVGLYGIGLVVCGCWWVAILCKRVVRLVGNKIASYRKTDTVHK